MTRPKTVMPLKHFKKLVDEAYGLGATTISIFGFGEPLLDPTILQKVHYCTKNKLETFLTTNASLLDVNMTTGLYRAGLSHIRFSVHGITPDHYEAVHRGLKYNLVMRNIFNFIATNNAKWDHACKTSITFIPMHNESVELIRANWEHRVDWLEVWNPHNWVTGRSYRLPTRVKTTCGRPHKGPIQIQADGTVIPCCFLTNSEIVLGTTYKNTIEEILKGDEYARLRKSHETGKVGRWACKSCDQLNINEDQLLYSNRDNGCSLGTTSSIKFKLEDN